MASKKDLIDAQAFSRRRLLTAFTSGAPGGKEVEPSSPLKAVIASVVLAVMVVLGGVFYGLVRPGLPTGWESNTLVLVRDTGARYLSMAGTLYPVVNATSARLLMPAAEYAVVSVDASAISQIPVGPSIGILGAPDEVPPAGGLVPTGWTACPAEGGTAVSLPGEATTTAAGAVVTNGGAQYVVAGGVRHQVAAADGDAVLRALGLAEARPVPVDSRWLNLFTAGSPLEPLSVPDAGTAVPGTDLVVGAAVQPQGGTQQFLVTSAGELAPLSPVAYQMYLLGTGALLGGAGVVTPGEISSLATATDRAGAADWPVELLAPLAPESRLCAALSHDDAGTPTTVLAEGAALADDSSGAAEDGVTVALRGGALVAAGGAGNESARTVMLVDESGTAYPIPEADADVLARLGYEASDVSFIPAVWVQFFGSGPSLTVAGAGSTPTGIAVAEHQAPPSEGTVADAVAGEAGARCEPGTILYSTERPHALGMLQATDAWARATGAGVVVAVVDSGIDVGNAHLRDVVIGGVNLVEDGERDDGMSDPGGHGTAVAGLIAAQQIPESGVVGLAPDARLLSVRVFRGTDEQSIRDGHGPTAQRLAAGIDWAVENGADVINVSLSDDADSPGLRAAVANAAAHGALVVASAGNRNTAANVEDSARYPAAYGEALAVTATDAAGLVTADSIHGAHVDVAAPGSDVLTTTTGGGDCLYASDEASSSYATGYVSAAAALVKEAHPGDTPAELHYRLTASAVRGDADARDDLAGWGVVQPLDAIMMVPGAEVRGPANPFTGVQAAPVRGATVDVEGVLQESPLAHTRDIAMRIGAVSLVALVALTVTAVYRRRQAVTVGEEQSRPGLLDSPGAAPPGVLDDVSPVAPTRR